MVKFYKVLGDRSIFFSGKSYRPGSTIKADESDMEWLVRAGQLCESEPVRSDDEVELYVLNLSREKLIEDLDRLRKEAGLSEVNRKYPTVHLRSVLKNMLLQKQG